MLSWFLILLGVWVWWMSGHRRRRRLRQIAKELPTNIPAVPVLGQAHIFVGTDEDRWLAFQMLGRDALQHGGIMAYWAGNDVHIALADPVLADLLLKSCLHKSEMLMRFTRVFVGNGSLSAPVHIWRPRRKILSPIFNPRNLNAFVKVFARQSATMVELLQPRVGTGDFSIWKYIASYTFDSVCETNLGVKINSQKKSFHPFMAAFDEQANQISKRMCQPWIHSDFVYKMLPSYEKLQRTINYINSFVKEIIQEKRSALNEKKLENNGNEDTELKLKTLLEMIMNAENETKLNDLELLEEAKVIIAAGTDTSAVGACYTLAMLSRHPEVQDSVFQELYRVFGDSDREVAVEDLPKFTYLEAVIKETLRLYPPVPAIVRETVSDMTLPNGTILDKGITIVMLISAMHRNQQYWGKDADIFRPERFFEPLKHPAQFIPFSYGMRNCLGYQYAMMSLKTVLATILRMYRVLPPSKLDPTKYSEPIRSKWAIMMRDVDNFVVQLEKRT